MAQNGTNGTAIMFRHGELQLQQKQLFPRGGKADRNYRKALKYTAVYNGDLTSYDDLLAAGEKVTVLRGQVRSSNEEEEEARFVTAMKDMSPNTKKIYLADCAAAMLPPPCDLHRTSGDTSLPWRETVKALVKVGVIPSPWLAADGSVHSRYTGQLYCAKVNQLMGCEVGNDGRRQACEDAARARLPNGSSTSDDADYCRSRWFAIVARALRMGVPIPKHAEVRADPDKWEPDMKQPKYSDCVICESCGFNVASRRCSGLVLWSHNHHSKIALLTRVCWWCDKAGRPVTDDLLRAGVAAPEVTLGAECVLRLMGRGGDLGEVSTRADAIVAKALAACARAKWAARDTPPEDRRTRPKSRRLNPPAPSDVLMAPAPPASPASSRSRSPSPPPPPSPSPPPRRRSPRIRAPGADDDAEYDQYLAHATRLLDKMAGLSSCSRAGRARGALEILRS